MAIEERLKQESMYGLSAKKNGRCGEMGFSGELGLGLGYQKVWGKCSCFVPLVNE